jgi:hypothetical protein
LRRRAQSFAAVLALTLLMAACGSAPSGDTVAAKRAADQADLDRVRQAAEAVRDLPTGRYVVVQSLQATPDATAQVLMTRRGQYDEATGLHQVEVSVPPMSGKPAVELTFLNGDGEFFMKNALFTARHGKTWTQLPANAVQEAVPGIGDTSPLPEPPGLDVLATAATPGEVSLQKDLTQYKVTVDMYEAIALLSNSVGYAKIADLSGVTEEDLPTKFSGTLDATVVVGPGLRSLNVNESPIFARVAELSGQPDGTGGGTLRVNITFQPGASVEIMRPDQADVGPLQ